MLRHGQNEKVNRGRLRIYVGAAAGVGTTFAMVDEALRRQRRGTDVVIGWVDAHGRPVTSRMIEELSNGQPVPTRLDVESVIERAPSVVLVDELGRHTLDAEDSSRNWEAVEKILAAGIDVIATANVQHFASLAEPVATIIGRPPDGFVPDRFVVAAEQIEMVDSTPEAIRRRIAHGNVFVGDELMPTDGDLFNTDAFARLRLLLLRWMAAHLAHRIDRADGIAERVVVGVGDSSSSSIVVRRAARLAQEIGAELVGVHVSGDVDIERPDLTEARRRAVEAVGGRYLEVRGVDVGRDLLSVARSVGATQVVIGSSPRVLGIRSGVAAAMLRGADDIDVHVVPTRRGLLRRKWNPATDPITSRNRIRGFGLAAVTLVGLTVLLVANRDTVSVATGLSLYLFLVVVVTALGGRWPGLLSALVAPLVANWYLIPPYHTFRISAGENILELGVFVSVSVIISAFVATTVRRTGEAESARREAEVLSAFTILADLESLEPAADLLRRTFAFEAVSIASSRPDRSEPFASSGDQPPVGPSDADVVVPFESEAVFLARGALLSAQDHALLVIVLRQVGVAIEQRRLRAKAIEAETLARADDLRTAILRAVSHDLRSPLANIKASVSSLRQTDVTWPLETQGEFLASVESETDRLTSIVTNLLDLSRLEAGVVKPNARHFSIDDVLPAVIDGLGSRGVLVAVELPEVVIDIENDPALLERILGNLLENALRWSPPDHRVVVRVHSRADEVQIHVIDHGPGIPSALQSSVVQPFHRLGDVSKSDGLGLGLAIADRMLAAMGGRLELRDTPGGGLTAVVALPVIGQVRT